MQEIIAVHEKDVSAFRGLQCRIPRDAHPFIGLVDDPDPPVVGRAGIQQRSRTVGTSVIDTNGFPVFEGLRLQAPKTPSQKGLDIVRGYDDGNRRHHSCGDEAPM